MSLVEGEIERWLDKAAFGAGFWTLMIVLSALAFVPLALGRAFGPGLQGVTAQLVALMAGNVVIFGVMAQAYTLELFWREVSACRSGGQVGGSTDTAPLTPPVPS